MSASIVNNEIILTGDVGDFGDGLSFFTAETVRQLLADLPAGERATVRLNSGGGVATEGTAIAAVFAAHPGGVEVVVEGIAASAASVAACGAARVIMAAGALMMLHEPSGFTVGTAEDHVQAIAGLSAINDAMATLYAKKTGKPVATVRAWMAAETWFTPDEAVKAGLADGIVGQANPKRPARFAYAAYYKHPPAALRGGAPRPQAAAPTPAAAPAETYSEETDRSPRRIRELCASASLPEAVTAALVRDGATVATARKRIETVEDIRDIWALASIPHQRRGVAPSECPVPIALRDQFILSGASVATARAGFLQAMVDAEGQPINGIQPRRDIEAQGRASSRQNMVALLKQQGLKPVERQR